MEDKKLLTFQWLLDLKKVCSILFARGTLNHSIGQCIKCLMTQKTDTCSDQVCTKLLVESNGESKIIVHDLDALLLK